MLNAPLPSPTAGEPVGPAERAPSDAPAATRRVVDAPMRMFHALFALSFLGAWLTADSERWRAVHVTLGYAFGGLLVFRLLYGLLGPKPVGLRLLWRRVGGGLYALRRRPGAAPAAAGLTGRLGVDARALQNLAMALVILLLLAAAPALVLSGHGNHNDWDAVLGGELLEAAHEAIANAMLALVLAHLGLIALLSLLRRQNQALPMLTGRVPGRGPDLLPRNRGGLAALVLAGFVAWLAWSAWAGPLAGEPGEPGGPAAPAGSGVGGGAAADEPLLKPTHRGGRHHGGRHPGDDDDD